MITFILFQVVWFMCVIGKNSMALHTSIFIILLFLYNRRKCTTTKFYKLVLIGFGNDQLMQLLGVFHVDESVGVILPFWMLLLWLGFSISFLATNADFYFRKLNFWVRGILGGTSGMFSYFAGEKLQAIHFNFDLHINLLILFVSWFVLTEIFVRIPR